MAIPASNISEVITELDIIIQKSLVEKDKLGVFAALYRKVTQRVQEGIAAGQFEDGARMEKLDVIFANRYLVAHQEYIQNKPMTSSWRLTFEASKMPNILLIQHLLAGINTHISLDLGIATANVASGNALSDLEQDFNEINQLLSDLIDSVEKAMGKSMAMVAALDWISGKIDKKIAQFSLEFFRNRAWHAATTFYDIEEPILSERILELDNQTTKENFILTVLSSGVLPPFMSLLAWAENRKVISVINAISNI